MEVGRRVRPENVPVVFNVGLKHEDAIIDFIQEFVVFIKIFTYKKLHHLFLSGLLVVRIMDHSFLIRSWESLIDHLFRINVTRAIKSLLIGVEGDHLPA